MIRQAMPSDLERVKEIIDLSFPWFLRYFASHSVSDFDEPTLVSEFNGSIGGFAKIMELQVGAGKYGCILWIAVHPNFRRRGLALTLTTAAVEQLKTDGLRIVFASTQRRNKAAQATLGKLGFKRIGFVELWRMFRWRIFRFYIAIWFVPGEVVLIHLE